MDTKHPLQTFEGKGAKEAAQRATEEGALFDIASRWGQKLVARVVKDRTYKSGGEYRHRAVWGVFLKGDDD